MTKERIQKQLRKERNRSYLARDFDSFRSELLRYARAYFPDKIRDFSENSLGGLFLDMNAYVGDNLSFYLDHQFRELNPNTAVETENIESHLRNAGVKIVGASPAVVTVELYVEVFAIQNSDGELVPDRSLLPNIRQGTVFRSTSGINFYLTEDVDFTELDENGDFVARKITGSPATSTSNGTFILVREGICLSGNEVTENISIPNQFVPFRTIKLSRPNVTEIISVRDTNNNTYFEVDFLTQSNIFRESKITEDKISALELVPAPYRYITETSLQNRITSIRFGSGDADSLDDDIVPDPSDVALPLFGRSNFSRLSIDPNRLLDTQTLGISPKNTVISIKYRHGGGSNHNVGPNSIRIVKTLIRDFPQALLFDTNNYSSFPQRDFNSLAGRVINSVDVTNPNAAAGGSPAPSVSEFRSQINSSKFLQSRIVSKSDLLARIYSLPAKFGRVYRAAVVEDPNNPGGSPLVYIISRNSSRNLVVSSDTLKKNLSLYLNEFRLISDSVDFLDAKVINFRIKYKVLIDPSFNKAGVLKSINTAISNSIKLANFQINQPIVRDDINNTIINQQGVISLVEMEFENVDTDAGNRYAGRVYSGISYDFSNSLRNGIYTPPVGGIFELKYPNSDILGASV